MGDADWARRQMAADEADDWERLGADAEGRLPLTHRRLRGRYPELRWSPVAGDPADSD